MHHDAHADQLCDSNKQALLLQCISQGFLDTVNQPTLQNLYTVNSSHAQVTGRLHDAVAKAEEEEGQSYVSA